MPSIERFILTCFLEAIAFHGSTKLHSFSHAKWIYIHAYCQEYPSSFFIILVSLAFCSFPLLVYCLILTINLYPSSKIHEMSSSLMFLKTNSSHMHLAHNRIQTTPILEECFIPFLLFKSIAHLGLHYSWYSRNYLTLLTLKAIAWGYHTPTQVCYFLRFDIQLSLSQTTTL